MNADVKQAWLAALRSGGYQQGVGQLNRRERYCCLGVLCDLHAQAGLGHWDGEDYYVADSRAPYISILPKEVAQWAGLDDTDPPIKAVTLSFYNDGVRRTRPHTFAEIADLIEAHL